MESNLESFIGHNIVHYAPGPDWAILRGLMFIPTFTHDWLLQQSLPVDTTRPVTSATIPERQC